MHLSQQLGDISSTLDLVEAAALPMAVETAFRSLEWLGVAGGNACRCALFTILPQRMRKSRTVWRRVQSDANCSPGKIP
jgi:hypothetical protein